MFFRHSGVDSDAWSKIARFDYQHNFFLFFLGDGLCVRLIDILFLNDEMKQYLFLQWYIRLDASREVKGNNSWLGRCSLCNT
jgi:hypothetical protein